MGVWEVKWGAHCLRGMRTARASHSVLYAGSPTAAWNSLRSPGVTGTPKYSATPWGPTRRAPIPHGEVSVVIIRTFGSKRANARNRRTRG
eukprot:9487998-Alexandrium_andersonii.AAC.1